MRELVYDVLSEDNGVTIYDLRSLDWNTFPYTNGFTIHKISKDEIYKPYLISVKYYSSIDYEDIILILNNIIDIFDVVPGTELRIPKLSDIRLFILNNRK